MLFFFFFFFSSRRRHTRCSRDWSSEVCSSDLTTPSTRPRSPAGRGGPTGTASPDWRRARSEERRVGKRVDLGGRRIIKKKKRGDMGAVEQTIKREKAQLNDEKNCTTE